MANTRTSFSWYQSSDFLDIINKSICLLYTLNLCYIVANKLGTGNNMNILPAFLIALLFVLCEGAFHDRKIFVSKFAGKAIRSHANLKAIRTQIRNDALASLKALPQVIKADLLKEAEKRLQSGHWPQLTASGYMSYYHTGSRSPFSGKTRLFFSYELY